jgi:hypothetical protein
MIYDQTPSSDGTSTMISPRFVNIHLPTHFPKPFDQMTKQEVDTYYSRIMDGTIEKKKPLVLFPLTFELSKQENEIKNGPIYENHNIQLLISICDTIVGSIYGYVRDHCNQMDCTEELFKIMEKIVKITMVYKQKDAQYEFYLKDNCLKIFSSPANCIGIQIQLKEEFFPIIMRFLFNLNPFAYKRCISLPSSHLIKEDFTEILFQMKYFEEEYQLLTLQKKRKNNSE